MTIPMTGPIQPETGTGYLSADAIQVQDSGGAGFGATLAGAVDNVQQLESHADELAIKAVTGNLSDIHTATLAATRAQVTLELVATLRNKGIGAFNEIMRMHI